MPQAIPTSSPEADTLDTVCVRGATTDEVLLPGGVTLDANNEEVIVGASLDSKMYHDATTDSLTLETADELRIDCGVDREVFVYSPVAKDIYILSQKPVTTPSGVGHNIIIGGGTTASQITTGFSNVIIGYNAARYLSTGQNNFALGSEALNLVRYGSGNVAIGKEALKYAGHTSGGSLGSYNIGIGWASGYSNSTGYRNLYLGPQSGWNQTTGIYQIFIDNRKRGSAALDLTDSLIYGKTETTPEAQVLRLNAEVTLPHAVVHVPDEITATSEGVAASIQTVNTEVTTNNDGDLDNVTLANGTSGQIKHIYCVNQVGGGDTWKITPATMCGGTQITFTGVGEGCTLSYADSEGWVVTGNNGGTIT